MAKFTSFLIHKPCGEGITLTFSWSIRLKGHESGLKVCDSENHLETKGKQEVQEIETLVSVMSCESNDLGILKSFPHTHQEFPFLPPSSSRGLLHRFSRHVPLNCHTQQPRLNQKKPYGSLPNLLMEASAASAEEGGVMRTGSKNRWGI